MDNNNEKIALLTTKLDNLSRSLDYYSAQIHDLRREIARLKLEEQYSKKLETTNNEPESIKPVSQHHVPIQQAFEKEQPTKSIAAQLMKKAALPETKSDFEKFVGGNLANKIGIIITVLGVAIGVKYAIDHQLITPLGRIILGYTTGIALLLFALKLKKNYKKFSSVLLSGAMAILYFITYAAYAYYSLIPVGIAFALMVLFTAFTVLASLKYNSQLIAIYGLTGAYAVPFLLSDGSGKILIMFSYMAIINTGILVIALKKYWKKLFYFANSLTWLIYLAWYLPSYNYSIHFHIAIAFATIFFLQFYATFLSYKFLKNENFGTSTIVTIISNSIIYYSLGYDMLNNSASYRHLTGIFTLANAALHLLVAYIINRRRLSDKKLLYLTLAIAISFISIAIPVQLNGRWVTLLWSIEASLLFWLGRTKRFQLFELLSYAMATIAFISLADDWQSYYNSFNIIGTKFVPIFNECFLTAIWFAGCIGLILYIKKRTDSLLLESKWSGVQEVFNYLLPTFLLFALYNTGFSEISAYWDNKLYNNVYTNISGIVDEYNPDYGNLKIVWIINFTLLFLTALSKLNIVKLQERKLGIINLLVNVFALLVSLAVGLYAVSELREAYLGTDSIKRFVSGADNIYIRYVLLVCIAILLTVMYDYLRAAFMRLNFPKAFELVIYTTIIWVLSSELIHWLDMAGSTNLYKSGLSILWGSYSLLLIVIGIVQRKKHLRLAAFFLFAITLLKLFFYDLMSLSTIAKTIVMVSLGALLLVISFLYNKYKNALFGDE